MNPCELTAGITALANAIACRLDDDALAVTSAALVQLGETLETIAVQREICARRREACRAARDAGRDAGCSGETAVIP